MRGPTTEMESQPAGAAGVRRDEPAGASAGRWQIWVLGLLASIPIVAQTVDVLQAGWVPLADDAMIAISALDVLTGDPPLLGPWSSGYSDLNGENTFHPGPLLFWLLALPTRVLDPGSLEVTAAVVNMASVLGTIALARRRGGAGLMLAFAVAIPLMLASLPAEVYSDIWNPSAPILPFMLLLMLAWSVACGEYRLLPITVAVASFVPQCHLAFLVPTLAAFAVAAGGLGVSLRGTPRGSRPGTRPVSWIVAAVAMGLLCWSAPLVDQAVNRPGNLVLIWQAATTDKATLGLDQAWRAAVHTVGVGPWWLGDPHVGLDRVIDLTIRPAAGTIASAALILMALVALVPIGLRLGRRDVAAGAALAVALVASVALVTASTPEDSFTTLGYGLRWASPAGMWIWLVLGWSAVTLLPTSLRGALRARAAAVIPRPALAAIAVVAVAVPATLTARAGELKDEPYDQMQTISDRAKAELPDGAVSRVDVAAAPGASFMALNLGSGMVYALRRDGRRVVAPAFANYLGPEYAAAGTPVTRIVRIDVDRPAPRGARVVARVRVRDVPDPGEALAPEIAPVRTVTVSFAGAPPGP